VHSSTSPHHRTPPDDATPPPPQSGIPGMVIPVVVALLIGAVFVSVYLAAFHQPAPHSIPVAVVASDSEVQQLQNALDQQLPSQLDVQTYTDVEAAAEAVRHREVYGAWAPAGAGGPVLLVAGANGAAVTGLLTQTLPGASQLASSAVQVQDLVPLSAGDTRGLSIFYTAFGLVLASYLFGIISYQAAPHLRLGQRLVSLTSFGVLGGLLIPFLAGDAVFGALPGSYLTLAGLISLTTIAVGAATMTLMRLLGPAGTPLAAIVLLILGNATSGGILPTAYLPDWLSPLSRVLPVGTGVRAVQGAAYFDNDAIALAVAVLAAWIISCACLLYLVDVRAARHGQARNAPPARPLFEARDQPVG